VVSSEKRRKGESVSEPFADPALLEKAIERARVGRDYADFEVFVADALTLIKDVLPDGDTSFNRTTLESRLESDVAFPYSIVVVPATPTLAAGLITVIESSDHRTRRLVIAVPEDVERRMAEVANPREQTLAIDDATIMLPAGLGVMVCFPHRTTSSAWIGAQPEADRHRT
jgi:hypothetical protein